MYAMLPGPRQSQGPGSWPARESPLPKARQKVCPGRRVEPLGQPSLHGMQVSFDDVSLTLLRQHDKQVRCGKPGRGDGGSRVNRVTQRGENTDVWPSRQVPGKCIGPLDSHSFEALSLPAPFVGPNVPPVFETRSAKARYESTHDRGDRGHDLAERSARRSRRRRSYDHGALAVEPPAGGSPGGR